MFKTTLYRYQFPSADHPEYQVMRQRIKDNADGRGRWMNTWGGSTRGNSDRFKLIGQTGVVSEQVELDPSHLFNNQWNEAGEGGRRLFDWFEEYQPNHNETKTGHWLEITAEMAEARRQTLKCAYCASQCGPYHAAVPTDGFCSACLDSEYLKTEDLHLLRLLPIIEDGKPTAHQLPLTDDEKVALTARYTERQTTGTDSRAKKTRDQQRATILEKFEKTIAGATIEKDGLLWLWDRNINLGNVIYYSHTGEFAFGWRSPLAPDVKKHLSDLLAEFPFPYELK